jgi:hypothetical protein
MPDEHISAAIAKHKELSLTPSLPHESPNAYIPPELQRIEHAVGATYKIGQPLPDGGVASVGRGEPHVIEINDRAKWNQAPLQTKGHEIVHLWASHLPGKIREAIPPDDPDPKKRYDISDVDQLRASGKTLATIPQEKSATIIQTWIADPSQRKRLQPWMNDLTSVPLSTVQPTSPTQQGINTTPRAPTPPIEAYQTVAQTKQQTPPLTPAPHVAKPKPASGNPLPPQPKEALNRYPNPEDQPPKISYAFNKQWAKPGPYATKLSPQEEQEFRKWAAQNPQSIRGEVGPAPNFDPLPMADYDVRGHFHAAKSGDPAATLVPNKWDGKIHGNDKFKTPYNGGFSNESMYALPKAPRWVGDRLMTFDGKLVTDETPRKPGVAR